MALTIVETPITGGVDTHADVHVAAALDPVGGLLGVAEFPVTPAGYARLLSWLSGFGTVCLVGIEGTGSYGAGLARHVATAGIRVVEAGRSDRQDRRRQGKSDLLTEHFGAPAGHRLGGSLPVKLLTCPGPYLRGHKGARAGCATTGTGNTGLYHPGPPPRCCLSPRPETASSPSKLPLTC